MKKYMLFLTYLHIEDLNVQFGLLSIHLASSDLIFMSNSFVIFCSANILSRQPRWFIHSTDSVHSYSSAPYIWKLGEHFFNYFAWKNFQFFERRKVKLKLNSVKSLSHNSRSCRKRHSRRPAGGRASAECWFRGQWRHLCFSRDYSLQPKTAIQPNPTQRTQCRCPARRRLNKRQERARSLNAVAGRPFT